MRLITGIVIAHIAALVFGLAGLLIAVPNPHLWVDSEMGVRVYKFGMQYAGATHILLAATAMLLAGYRFLGLRRTLWFLAIACAISLTAELVGTTTGFPFGEYSYTAGLGYKILGEVPFTIPLSWFYMGLASYLLAIVLVGRGPGWRRPVGAVLLGSALLTIWDLVLDPAMAHQQLDVRFWIWHQEGLYFDMPVQNFLGWLLTGAVFIGISRLAWQGEPPLSVNLIRVAFTIYLANLMFAVVISAYVDLWWPVLITMVLGVTPAIAALLMAEGWSNGTAAGTDQESDDTVARVSRGVMTAGARAVLARDARLSVEGIENVPGEGPAILVARHYHHLLDGCALMVRTGRPVHILVALDWVRSGIQRSMLETACRMARWPVVIRANPDSAERFSEADRQSALRQAMTQSVELLSQGRLLVVFPEGYPNIDPHWTPKSEDDEFLPFADGFLAIAKNTQRRTGIRVPLIPVGFDYQRGPAWNVSMRVGTPQYLDDYADSVDLVRHLEQQVRVLSAPQYAGERSMSGTLSETS